MPPTNLLVTCYSIEVKFLLLLLIIISTIYSSKGGFTLTPNVFFYLNPLCHERYNYFSDIASEICVCKNHIYKILGSSLRSELIYREIPLGFAEVHDRTIWNWWTA